MGIKDSLDKQLSTPKGRLRWLFNFINTDIASLSRLDALPIFYGLEVINTRENLSSDEVQDSPDLRGEGKEIQKLLTEILEGIFACKSKITKKQEGETDLDTAVRLSERRYINIKDIPMKMLIAVQGERVLMEPSEEKHKVLLKFLDDLSKFSIDSVKQCERQDCQKYFFKGTKKEKRYCSDTCAWVMNSRLRRAKNHGKENEKNENPAPKE